MLGVKSTCFFERARHRHASHVDAMASAIAETELESMHEKPTINNMITVNKHKLINESIWFGLWKLNSQVMTSPATLGARGLCTPLSDRTNAHDEPDPKSLGSTTPAIHAILLQIAKAVGGPTACSGADSGTWRKRRPRTTFPTSNTRAMRMQHGHGAPRFTRRRSHSMISHFPSGNEPARLTLCIQAARPSRSPHPHQPTPMPHLRHTGGADRCACEGANRATVDCLVCARVRDRSSHVSPVCLGGHTRERSLVRALARHHARPGEARKRKAGRGAEN